MEYETFTIDSPSPPFLQMPKFVWEMDLSVNAKLVYMLIFDRIRSSKADGRFVNKAGQVYCYYSDNELADELGLKKRATEKAVSELKTAGLITRERTNTRDGKAVTYLSIPTGTAPECGTKDSFRTEMRNQTAPECGTKPHQNAEPFPYISENKLSKNNRVKRSGREEEAAEKIVRHWNERYKSKYRANSKETIKLVKNLLEADYEVDQIIRVIDYRAAKRKTQADFRWFVPSTVLALKNFQRSFEWMINDEAMMQGMDAYDGHVV